MNPGHWWLKIEVLHPFAALPLTWSGGRRHFRTRRSHPGSSPRRGHGSALPPYNLSTLAVGQLEGARPELFCHVPWQPLFSALLSPFLVLGSGAQGQRNAPVLTSQAVLDGALGGGVQPGWEFG